MTQILIILQGLLYTGLVVTLLARWAERRRPGPVGILAAGGGSLLVHLLATLLVPSDWRVTWLVFAVPGHILTTAVLLWLARKPSQD